MNHFLVADIGGTNARIGLVTAEGNEIFGIEQVPNKDFSSLVAVFNSYLRKAQCVVSPRKACFAVASPVVGDKVRFTNNSWSFSIQELKGQLGLEYLKVINDFEAVALSLPYLGEGETRKIGGGAAVPHQAIAVLGPGTGLGMAALVPALPKAIPLAAEGGHASFAPQDAVEEHIAHRLAETIGFVSNEDLLSGQGLINVYEGTCSYRKVPSQNLDAASIASRALEGDDPICRESLDRFCGILGSVAGDYALQIGAKGGVYIAGGIVPRFLDFFERSSFRQRFEQKGRFRGYMEPIPTYVVLASQPGLIGAASVFDEGTT